MNINTSVKLLACALLLIPLGTVSNAEENKVLRLATTTSTENSGLLRAILPEFEAASGYKVHVIAVGTGKALRMGHDGDVDVMLVHAPAAEKKFVADGFGVNRRQVMYNDFVIVGPAADPAQLQAMTDPVAALAQIAKQQAVFVSRGDNSGTHKKELSLWQAAGLTPSGAWYREAGQGMGKVLQMAAELNAYTLADRGTWLAMRDKLRLQIQVAGDPRLYNPYGIIAVHPGRHPHSNYQGAMQLIAWMTSNPGQLLIGRFQVHKEQLFVPMALKVADTQQ